MVRHNLEESAMTTVGELTKYGLFTCRPEARPGEVARLLLAKRIHGVVVAEPGGPPLGVISDTDLLAGEWLAGDEGALRTLREMTARDLMSTPVWSVDSAALVEEAIARLQEKEVHRLVVMTNGQPSGILSVSDIVEWMGRQETGRQTVGQVMSRGVVVCRADTPIQSVARAMTERRTRSVMVVGPRGQVQGVVTGVDLLVAWPDGHDGKTAADLMHPPVTIAPDATLSDAADLMLKQHIHRLVVLDLQEPEALPLGLISTSDIMAEMAAPGSAWVDAAG
jgi:CBS domain-containing protein